MASKINLKVVSRLILIIAVLILTSSTIFVLQNHSEDINTLTGKITGLIFSIPTTDFEVTASKPVAGFVFKYDNATPAYNASVIVYVNTSDPTANPCFTLPTVYTGTDGSYVTNLNNLKRADNNTQTCNWNSSDLIWTEANGSTMIPPEGSGTSPIAAIGSGTGLQLLDNFTLTKGDDAAPNVTLLSPTNASVIINNTVTFIYNVSDDRGINNCSLIINNNIHQTDSSVTNNATNNFTTTLVNGYYNWTVICHDTSGNYNSPPTWTLTWLLTVCLPYNAPVINTTIPDQKRNFNQGAWSLNLSSYKSDAEDSGANLVWSVQGVNPLFMDITFNGDNVTFTPNQNVSGLDKVSFILTDTDGFIDAQEVKISINRTLTFRDGWNLFSVPILENKTVQYILSPLGNGNYGCGRDGNPTNCNETAGDFVGNWTIIWTQNNAGSWIYFRPDVYYTFIPTQGLQTLEVDQGYWIDMNLTSPINLTLEYD
ncbi:MAG: hypothetical protein KAT77_01550 [Nanoarchaeota archaeon]|nr:hypothetical protein [Nanoarchaeota archaeon]